LHYLRLIEGTEVRFVCLAFGKQKERLVLWASLGKVVMKRGQDLSLRVKKLAFL
jgi:hypothetical protein